MDEAKVSRLFCCPVCKGELGHPAAAKFECPSCSLSFSKKGYVYDFRVDAQVAAARWQAGLAARFSMEEGWFANLRRHYSAEEFGQILSDPRVSEIETYTAALAESGVHLGERYDRELLVPESVRDLHELLIALHYVPASGCRNVALDLGCGTLRGTKALLKRGFDTVVAVDLIPEMMEHGLNKLGRGDRDRVALVRADARFLPIAEETIDLTFSLELFEHIDPTLLLLLELKRILARGGAAVLNTWNASGLSYRSNIKKKGRAYYLHGFYYRFYDRMEVEAMLRHVGVNYLVRPYGFYGGRRLAHMIGPSLLKPAIAADGVLSRILPSCLFPFLVLSFRRKED